MQVYELDLAEFPNSFLRKSHYMLWKSHYYEIAPYTAECAWYAADWFSIVDCTAVNLTLKGRTMFLAFIYIMPLLVNNLVETALI